MITEAIERTIDQNLIEAARNLIDRYNNIVVCTHMSPDGDAVGSSLAMVGYLRKKGKNAVVIYNDMPGDNLRFIPGIANEMVYDPQCQPANNTREEAEKAVKEAECFVITDLNVPSRLGDLGSVVMASQAPKILIDHHLNPSETDFDVVISHPEASAASELVYSFILQMGDDALVDKTIATQIYSGMMTDTGQFVFASNRPQVYMIVARLLQEDFNKEQLHRDLVLEPERRTRLKGFVLQQKLQIVREHKAAYFSLSKAELKRFNHQKGDSEGFVNMPLDISGIMVSAFFREEKNIIKVSLRSKGEYPVNLLAQKFYHGGGHRNAAGGEFLGTLEQAEQLFVKALPIFDKFL
ncbi:MAG: bifunctional oligoribonuclease/PAP phosphatase NrnA [Bacteroidales bacterium]|nr:bifunctional oligoribonuclease/PAP phosphatase NrnA [Candidatus Liminaster caballi]